MLSERAIARNDIIVRGRVIGGLQMIDGGEADDKIISVLENDNAWGTARDIRDMPPVLLERIQHYFQTYKMIPSQPDTARIGSLYPREHALRGRPRRDGRLRDTFQDRMTGFRGSAVPGFRVRVPRFGFDRTWNRNLGTAEPRNPGTFGTLITVSLNFLATRFQCSWPWDMLVMLCDGRIVCGCADPVREARARRRAHGVDRGDLDARR